MKRDETGAYFQFQSQANDQVARKSNVSCDNRPDGCCRDKLVQTAQNKEWPASSPPRPMSGWIVVSHWHNPRSSPFSWLELSDKVEHLSRKHLTSAMQLLLLLFLLLLLDWLLGWLGCHLGFRQIWHLQIRKIWRNKYLLMSDSQTEWILWLLPRGNPSSATRGRSPKEVRQNSWNCSNWIRNQ